MFVTNVLGKSPQTNICDGGIHGCLLMMRAQSKSLEALFVLDRKEIGQRTGHLTSPCPPCINPGRVGQAYFKHHQRSTPHLVLLRLLLLTSILAYKFSSLYVPY